MCGVRVCPGCYAGGAVRVPGIIFAIGVSRPVPKYVCHWVWGCYPGCCSGCSGSCLPLGGVGVNLLSRVLSGVLRIIVCHWAVSGCWVLFRVLRIMCGVRVLSRVLCRGSCQGAPGYVWCRVVSQSMFAIGCQGAIQGAVQGTPDHVCHWAVSGCCPGCSGSCLPLGGVRVLVRIMFAILLSRGCPAVLSRVLCSVLIMWLGGVRVLSRVLWKAQRKQSGTKIQRFNFYLGSILV